MLKLLPKNQNNLLLLKIHKLTQKHKCHKKVKKNLTRKFLKMNKNQVLPNLDLNNKKNLKMRML